MFGNLTQDFVSFGQAVASGDAASIPAAAAGFRSNAAKDASYLVYIGSYVHLYLVAIANNVGVQVWACSSARTCICLSGFTRARSTQDVSVRNICSRSCVRISHSLTRPVQGRWLPASRQIPVRRCSEARIIELWLTSLLRLGPTRHLGEGGPSCELLSCLRHWFRLGLHPKLAPGPRDDVGFALHRDHGVCHEQVCLQVYAVSSFLHADSWLLSQAHV